MKPSALLVISTAIILSACSSSLKTVPMRSLIASQTTPDSTGVSPRSALDAYGIARLATTPNVAGSPVSNGTGIGIHAANLLLRSQPAAFTKLSIDNDHLEAWMPLSMASDEKDAQLTMSEILLTAIQKTLSPMYAQRVEEYDDVSTLGIKSRHRVMRVDGPSCEAWSCVILAPIPTESALSWKGKMVKLELSGDDDRKPLQAFAYNSIDFVFFVRIKHEQDSAGMVSGKWKKFDTELIPEFDYERFYENLSANLPSWVYLYLAKNGQRNSYLLNSGRLLGSTSLSDETLVLQ